MPARIDLAPVKIRSGKWVDCQNICKQLHPQQCLLFIFYTPEFEGPLSSYCILFQEQAVDTDGWHKIIYMKNVISGEASPSYIFFDPPWDYNNTYNYDY